MNSEPILWPISLILDGKVAKNRINLPVSSIVSQITPLMSDITPQIAEPTI